MKNHAEEKGVCSSVTAYNKRHHKGQVKTNACVDDCVLDLEEGMNRIW
jgi:hypothetical protein